MNSILSSEIKTIFYIIAGAFYLFYKFYQKEKRKQEARSAGKKPVLTRTSEDIFRELQKSLKLPQEKVEPTYKTTPKARHQSSMMLERAYQKPGNLLADRNKLKKHEEESITVNEEPTLGERLDFDARKAVIYSELLKRPQY